MIKKVAKHLFSKRCARKRKSAPSNPFEMAAPSFALKGPVPRPHEAIDFSEGDAKILQELNSVPGKLRPLANYQNGPKVRDSQAPMQMSCFPDRSSGFAPERASFVPSPPSSSGTHAVCSKHGRHLSWRIQNFCHECDQIALAAANADE